MRKERTPGIDFHAPYQSDGSLKLVPVLAGKVSIKATFSARFILTLPF
jgi:hypothetical protein